MRGAATKRRAQAPRELSSSTSSDSTTCSTSASGNGVSSETGGDGGHGRGAGLGAAGGGAGAFPNSSENAADASMSSLKSLAVNNISSPPARFTNSDCLIPEPIPTTMMLMPAYKIRGMKTF